MNLYKDFKRIIFIGILATVIFHGGLLLLFLFTSLDTPPERPIESKIVPLEDVEVLMPDEEPEMVQDRKEAEKLKAENTVVNQADEREESMTDYGQWSKEDIDRQVMEEAKRIEQEEYQKRRDAGYEVPKWEEKEEEEKASENGESSVDPNKVSDKKYGGVAHVEYYLLDRTHRDLPSPAYVGAQTGKVVINIKVDEFGDVKDAEVNYNMTTTTNQNLIDIALRYAKRARFDFVKDGPKKQEGTITYTFESQ